MACIFTVRQVASNATPVGVLAGNVPAGWPSVAQDYIEPPVDLTEVLIRDRTCTFVVRVSGHSMQNAGISDGDELIVDRSLTPADGNVVIAVLDGELTVKRLRVLPGNQGVLLQAENPDYPTIQVPPSADLVIWGVVTRCLHHV